MAKAEPKGSKQGRRIKWQSPDGDDVDWGVDLDAEAVTWIEKGKYAAVVEGAVAGKTRNGFDGITLYLRCEEEELLKISLALSRGTPSKNRFIIRRIAEIAKVELPKTTLGFPNLAEKLVGTAVNINVEDKQLSGQTISTITVKQEKKKR